MNTPTFPQRLTLTVLVVDDNDRVRSIIARKLEQKGYRVLTAADGEQAMAVIEQSAIEVDLVVCDLVMPRVDGYELASRVAELLYPPELIFMTGYRSDLELDRGPTFTKPFLLDDLTMAAQRVLQRRIDTGENNPNT